MEVTKISALLSNENDRKEEFEKLLSSLPVERDRVLHDLYFYKGFWTIKDVISGTRSAMQHFQALDSDIILATMPKSGTTWLKALAFAIVNRSNHASSVNSLSSCNPHKLVPFIELQLYANNQMPDLSQFQHPRLFATHIPYLCLLESIKNSTTCKVVYLCRNPLDAFVSSWHFFASIKDEKYSNTKILSINDVFDTFCEGVSLYGPFWHHIVGYWEGSLKRPDKVLFFKYEEMMEDTISHVKKLATFLGFPFSKEEESDGVLEEIIKVCSFGHLKDLEVNQNGAAIDGVPNNSFFRKGEVGDWTNYLTPLMAERLNGIVEEKLASSGLTFKTTRSDDSAVDFKVGL